MKAIEVFCVSKVFEINLEQAAKGKAKAGVFIALSDISLGIEEGECTIIAGENGSGKSLLMSIIAGLENPTRGAVITNSRPGLVFQECDCQILGETPAEDIAFGPRNMGLSKSEIKKRVKAALHATGLEHRSSFPARSLSGGEKRRLAAAGVLAMDAKIIIFDEPYANMDYPGVIEVNKLIKTLIESGRTVVILTHELEKCLAFAHRFIVLYRGGKVYDGNVDEALSCDLEAWGIRNPLKNAAREVKDLVWI